MVKNKELDAIHVVTPILEHYPQTMLALEAGKHVACTVPMATSIEECTKILEASEKAGKYYMMMETSLYTREYLYVKALHDQGKFGRIQFMRSDHMQNMMLSGWGDYWRGFPPFHYGTHALSPVIELIGKRPTSVICHGSGHLSPDKAEKYNSPWRWKQPRLLLKIPMLWLNHLAACSKLSANAVNALTCMERRCRSNGS